ncbi:hypothetical protein HOY80DRAFT_1061453 [Tuber brumale]|nr:hypothetical protein HOY80DRAFT_1061453 [Tuber brumale]
MKSAIFAILKQHAGNFGRGTATIIATGMATNEARQNRKENQCLVDQLAIEN